MQPYLTLIRDQRACCGDLPDVEAVIGAAIVHPSPEDGTSHELNVYWRDTPAGPPTVELVSFDPLTIGPVDCPCTWSGTVMDGAVT